MVRADRNEANELASELQQGTALPAAYLMPESSPLQDVNEGDMQLFVAEVGWYHGKIT